MGEQEAVSYFQAKKFLGQLSIKMAEDGNGVLGIQAMTQGRGGGFDGALKKYFQEVIFCAFWCTLRQDWVILSKLNDCWHFANV